MRRKPRSLAHLDPKASPGPVRLLPTGTAALAVLTALVLSALALASRADAAVSASVSGSTLTVTAGAGTTDNLAIVRSASTSAVYVQDYPRAEEQIFRNGLAVDSGHVYWANQGGTIGTIGRANLDGTGVNQSFINTTVASGGFLGTGIAVDSSHVYWTNSASIGRANLNGTGANQWFISGASRPDAVAVDSGHVYWANYGTNSIGRANLNGTGVNQSFITGTGSPTAIAVDSGHLYWANGCIGRANLNGTGANQCFIGANYAHGVAVDSGHVYWTDFGTNEIGRANLDGTGVNESFIANTASLLSGVTVDSGHLYWANGGTGTIARANLDGTAIDLGFIDPPDGYTGSVVNPGAGCSNGTASNYVALCKAKGGITQINVSSGDRADRVENIETGIPSSLNGGAGGDRLIGEGSAADTLTGGPGVDVLNGRGGSDLLSARDLRSDATIDCGGGTDKADLDLLPKDPGSRVLGCETKTRH